MHGSLAHPSECITAITRLAGPGPADIATVYQALASVLGTVDARFFQLHALLMDRASFDANPSLAVTEPVHAPSPPRSALPPPEAARDQHLRTLDKGRLEQDFLPATAVVQAVSGWWRHG